MLQQEGKTLELRVKASGDISVDIEDVSSARNPQDSPNPGVSRIIIHQATPANSTAKLAVHIIPGSVAKKQTK